MQVIIPVAGLGTRLRPHTHTKPKPLVNVAGKPVLGHILDKLVPIQPSEIIFITGYLGEQIESYVSSHYSFSTHYVEQPERLGQAHAIYLAKPLIHEPVLIVFVDTIFEANLSELDKISEDGAIYVKEVEDPRRFGVVQLVNGLVTRLIEKPETPLSRLAVIGVYFIRNWPLFFQCTAQVLEKGPVTKGEYYIADALQLMIDRGARLVALPVEVWEDCGQPESVLQTNRYLLSKSVGQAPPTEDSILLPPVFVAETARVVRSIVGPYVTVGEGAQIINSIVRDSIVNEGAHIEDSTLTSSLIGSYAVVKGVCERLNVGDSSEVHFG